MNENCSYINVRIISMTDCTVEFSRSIDRQLSDILVFGNIAGYRQKWVWNCALAAHPSFTWLCSKQLSTRCVPDVLKVASCDDVIAWGDQSVQCCILLETALLIGDMLHPSVTLPVWILSSACFTWRWCQKWWIRWSRSRGGGRRWEALTCISIPHASTSSCLFLRCFTISTLLSSLMLLLVTIPMSVYLICWRGGSFLGTLWTDFRIVQSLDRLIYFWHGVTVPWDI